MIDAPDRATITSEASPRACEAAGASVLAVVLTHSAPRALARCLAAIEAQRVRPRRVVVVDNASEPRAAPTAARTPVDLVRLDVNSGPAGGHATGLTHFLEAEETLAWVMDDDCVPEPGCLEALLDRHRAEQRPAVVLPFYWLDRKAGWGEFRPAWCGFLACKQVVEAVGVPRADFVWWAEDTEYLQWRVQRLGFPLLEEPDAVVEHVPEQRMHGRPPWKIYYEVRNTVYFRLYVQRRPYRRFRRMAKTLLKTFGQIVVREDRKAAKLRAYVRGLADGLTCRLGLRMPLGDSTR